MGQNGEVDAGKYLDAISRAGGKAPAPDLVPSFGLKQFKVDVCQHANGLADELAERPVLER
jgi:hypothetical protein